MRLFGFLLLFTSLLQAQEIIQASITSLPEAPESSGMVAFNIELDRPSTVPVILNFSTKGHNAEPHLDFVPRTEVLTFNPGQVLKTINVVIIDDRIDEEAEELFQADLAAAGPNVVVISPFSLVSITDNEEVIDVQNKTVEESEATEFVELKIERDFPSKHPVILQVSSMDQTAVSGKDYVPYVGQVIFQPNELSKVIQVEVLGDKKPELKESFALKVEGIAVDIQMKNPLPMVNIEDNDGVLAVRFSATTETSLIGGGSFTLKETYRTGPVRLKREQNGNEVFYFSDSVVPQYRFFVPGQMTFPSTPGQFSIKKLSGVTNGRLDVENVIMHYMVGEMKCRLAAGAWMPCHFTRTHALMRLEDVHPNDQQLPGVNMFIDGFESVDEANADGIIVGRKTFEGSVPLPDPNVSDAKEFLTIELMLIEEEK